MSVKDLTQLVTDRDNLRAAVRSGVFQCSVDGQSTTFSNMRDLRAVLNDLERQIALITGCAERKPRVASIQMIRGV